MAARQNTENMALYCDFENIALGVRDAKFQKFDIRKVIERLLLKGNIVVKKAYCDWDRYKDFKSAMHEAAFELIEIPHVRQSGKNSADIRMVVDALDLCYTKSHVDTFVIISGDSDFSPLVSKLRENAKTVIGVGVKNSTSDLLIANCDEFIYYDDLVREQKKRGARKSVGGTGSLARSEPKAVANGDARPRMPEAPAATEKGPELPAAKAASKSAVKTTPARGRKRTSKAQSAEQDTAPPAGNVEPAPMAEAATPAESAPLHREEDKVHAGLDLIVGTVEALAGERGGEDKIWGSMVKQALKRVKPGFNESYYGFRSFNAMLEEAAARGLMTLERDGKSGGYIIRLTQG